MEELLAQMAAEDGDDGQEDALSLTGTAALAVFPLEAEEAAEAGTADGWADAAGTRQEPGELGRAVKENLAEDGRALENAQGSAGTDGVWAAEAPVQRQAAEAPEQAAWPPGTAWTWAAVGQGGGAGGETAGAASGRGAGAGLQKLYRQAAQSVRPAAPALSAEPAGRTIRMEEPGSAASLAVDELDRAVRRDSRRYDGGMSIF